MPTSHQRTFAGGTVLCETRGRATRYEGLVSSERWEVGIPPGPLQGFRV